MNNSDKTTIDPRNVFCPVSGCRNYGGKGFRRGGISKHIESQHANSLKKTSADFTSVSEMLKSFDKKICVICSKISKRCTQKGLCDK